jgi:DNA invertase Pin-like site-specific DNA recombinase
MKKLGYVRTSTDQQLTDRQVNQLTDICDEVYIESGVSGAKAKRPVYESVLLLLESGDTLVVSSADRAYRCPIIALTELKCLTKRGVHLSCLSHNFDTTTPDGKFLFTMAVALGAWEREILVKRTKEGLEAAKRRGKKLGRPKKLSPDQLDEARKILESEIYSSITEVAEHFRVHETTLVRALESE